MCVLMIVAIGVALGVGSLRRNRNLRSSCVEPIPHNARYMYLPIALACFAAVSELARTQSHMRRVYQRVITSKHVVESVMHFAR